MAALRQQKITANFSITAKDNVTLPNKLQEFLTMNNYFRITAYNKSLDLSVIADSFGKFEKLWQFSAFLVCKGFEIIAVGKDESFSLGDIPKAAPNNEKILIRAVVQGRPADLNGKISVANKRYSQN